MSKTTDLAPGELLPDATTDAAIVQPRDLLAGKTIEQLFEIAERFAATDMVPKQFRGKGADIAVCWAFGASLGINPMQSLTSIAVVNGQPSVWGTAVGALVQAQPDFADMVERNNFADADKTMDLWAECELQFRSGRAAVVKRYTYKQAVAAGLTGKDNWKNHPQMMLENRARNWAARVAFPGALKGFPVREEMLDEAPVRPADFTVRDAEPAEPKKGNDALADALADVVGEPANLRASVFDDGHTDLPQDSGTVFYSREHGSVALLTDDGIDVDVTANAVELLRTKFVDTLRAFIEEGGDGVPDAKALREFCKKGDDLKKLPKTLEDVTIPTLAAAYDAIVAGKFPA